MDTIIFYLFSILAVVGGVMLVLFRNPVSSALSMVLSFVGMAGLFIGLNAYFVGIIQILVYAGAIMVLFIFIIMLLDLNEETKAKFKTSTIIAGVILPLMLVVQVLGVLQSGEDKEFTPITKESLAISAENENLVGQDKIREIMTHPTTPQLPDTNLIGMTIFRAFNFPLQVMGVLLLVATVGVVVLSKRSSKSSKS
ncbi:NADH-quinone oxidoreductase subunit J [bacterium]|nr:NADH-quinone oxidoreductase subunit J [Akkermansiaceae bacterium]MDB4522460.1 NADH-quinone oxidoreductase subunit J [bacterium]MDB4568183.1 NADH-quinone oxidoreductase subunit J [Akkermansiaceae bacterium]